MDGAWDVIEVRRERGTSLGVGEAGEAGGRLEGMLLSAIANRPVSSIVQPIWWGCAPLERMRLVHAGSSASVGATGVFGRSGRGG